MPNFRQTNPTRLVRPAGGSRPKNPQWTSRNASPSTKLSFDGAQQNPHRGSPLRGSVYGIVTQSPRGSLLRQPHDMDSSDHRLTSAPSHSDPTSISPARSRPPRPADEVHPMASPPVIGGKARDPLLFNPRQTPTEIADATANDAYYLQSLLQLAGWMQLASYVNEGQAVVSVLPLPDVCHRQRYVEMISPEAQNMMVDILLKQSRNNAIKSEARTTRIRNIQCVHVVEAVRRSSTSAAGKPSKPRRGIWRGRHWPGKT